MAGAAGGLTGCGDEGNGPSSPEPDPTVQTREALSSSWVDRYMIHYGSWDQAALNLAKTHRLVILHPSGGNVTRQQVAEIQGGTNPADPTKRVLVLAYVTVGEDDRTVGLTPQQMRADPRFVGDGTGPRIDPRGPFSDGQPLTSLPPLGLPSNGGTGFASWYLDDNSVRNSANKVGDGIPDRNAVFGGTFVNAGDPKWFDVLQNMTLDGVDRKAGLREILTTTTGRGLGCDGIFMDTFDTCAPNRWTDASSGNQSEFEWTAAGFTAFTKRLRETYPSRLILQNRGLFFFDPRLPHYKVNPRSFINFAFFESYRLNSSQDSAVNPHPVYYPDNRHNFAPKLMAEAGRPDGFQVLSLGYAAGSPDQMSEKTLRGESTLGYDSLIEDIRVTQPLAGFRHYLTNPAINYPNAFVRDHSSFSDAAPPVWTSTYNVNESSAGIAAAPTPRVGIRQVVPVPNGLTVRWDVALDLHRVRYALYYQTQPFNFASNPGLSGATRVVLNPSLGASYGEPSSPTAYPYEARITGLTPGATYHLVVRAFDASPAANEERNQVVLTGVPQSGGTELTRWRASNGVSDVTYRFQYGGTWDWKRAWIDRDRNTATGFHSAAIGVGADFLIENGWIYRYTGTGSTWSWAAVSPNPVLQSTGLADGMTWIQWTFPQQVLGSVTDANLVFQVEKPGAWMTSYVYRHLYTSTSTASPFYDSYAENDADKIYYHTRIRPTFTWKHVFIDEDENGATGYPIGGIGAGYLIENGRLYRHNGSGWSWTLIGDAHHVVSGDSNSWWIRRMEIGETKLLERARLLFRGNGVSTPAASPVTVHAYSP